MLTFTVHKVNLFSGASRDKTEGSFKKVKKFLREESSEQARPPRYLSLCCIESLKKKQLTQILQYNTIL